MIFHIWILLPILVVLMIYYLHREFHRSANEKNQFLPLLLTYAFTVGAFEIWWNREIGSPNLVHTYKFEDRQPELSASDRSLVTKYELYERCVIRNDVSKSSAQEISDRCMKVLDAMGAVKTPHLTVVEEDDLRLN